MANLNEKTVATYNRVITEQGLNGTYEASAIYETLNAYWSACSYIILVGDKTIGYNGYANVEECISLTEKYLLSSGFNKAELEDIRFDAAFEGLMLKMQN